jgi:glyoxylase-like metal-dependent hydrolase (beta-lactamase superfamily II)
MSPIVMSSGEFLPNIHLVDLRQFGMKRITSSYAITTGHHCTLFDCGTTDDVRKLLQYLRKSGIALEAIDYIVPSHHHFDHFYGVFKLFPMLAEKNPEVKILCTQVIADRLNDPIPHLERAKRTYGDMVGRAGQLPENAFEIVEPGARVDVPGWPGYILELIPTPGHEPEHQSPTIWSPEGKPLFCFAGEASGSHFHSSKVLTLPTSMPPGFRYDVFMESLDKLIQIAPQNIGFCHFGAVTGAEDSAATLQDQKEFISFYRAKIRELFEEYQATRPVVEAIKEIVSERADFPPGSAVIDNIILAIVYGMLVDLGFKEPSL